MPISRMVTSASGQDCAGSVEKLPREPRAEERHTVAHLQRTITPVFGHSVYRGDSLFSAATTSWVNYLGSRWSLSRFWRQAIWHSGSAVDRPGSMRASSRSSPPVIMIRAAISISPRMSRPPLAISSSSSSSPLIRALPYRSLSGLRMPSLIQQS
jgi:hypothetical protein